MRERPIWIFEMENHSGMQGMLGEMGGRTQLCPTFAPKEFKEGTKDPQASPFSMASDHMHPHIPHASESGMDSVFLTTWEDEDGGENDDFFEDHFIGHGTNGKEYVPHRSFLSLIFDRSARATCDVRA